MGFYQHGVQKCVPTRFHVYTEDFDQIPYANRDIPKIDHFLHWNASPVFGSICVSNRRDVSM